MKKKIATLILTAVMAASFAACGNAAPAVQSPESAPTVESSVEESSVSEATTAPETTEAPVATEKPTASPEATPEPTTAPTAAPTVEPTVEPTPVPTEEPKDAYTFTDMSATMYAKSSVNVRDLPSTDGSKVGSLNTNSEVAVTGKCNETGWYRFAMNGQDVYVSGSYLQSTKVQVATQAGSQGTSGSASATQQAGSAPSGTASADAGSADGASENGGNAEQGSSSDVSWELIADVEGGKIYQGSDGSQMSVSDSGVVDVTPAENIGNGQTDLPPEMTEEDWELVHQLEDLIKQQNGGN